MLLHIQMQIQTYSNWPQCPLNKTNANANINTRKIQTQECIICNHTDHGVHTTKQMVQCKFYKGASMIGIIWTFSTCRQNLHFKGSKRCDVSKYDWVKTKLNYLRKSSHTCPWTDNGGFSVIIHCEEISNEIWTEIWIDCSRVRFLVWPGGGN